MSSQSSLTLRDQLKRSGWIPPSKEALDHWIKSKLKEIDDKPNLPVSPVIEAFRRAIESDPEIYMCFIQMFEQGGSSLIPNYTKMLELFNLIIISAPIWSENDGTPGLPINNILSSVIVTPAGFTTFSLQGVNQQLKNVLNAWKNYLHSPASADVLNTDVDTGGWLSPKAIAEFSKFLPNNDFVAAFECDPSKPHWGFKSWDDFFTRPFRPHVRPPPSPYNPNTIASACESTVYRISYKVKEFDKFWLKGEPYALKLMLADEDLAPNFYGGTVYQAFLSTKDYHRWHSPVKGKVVKTCVVPGTYYALSPDLVDKGEPEITSIIEAQGFLSIVATRAVIFIEAENPAIGLMCFIAVGMIEVSSCEIIVHKDDIVQQGQELGTFHYGGSTHCLVFRKETPLSSSSHWNVKVGDHVGLRQPLITLPSH